MTIALQGAWTVRVKSKNAAFAHRFIIAGATTGNGTYVGEVATPAINVTGAQWSVSIENNPTGPVSWSPSANRITFPVLSAGQISFDIRSDDAGGDGDYNDLILTSSIAASPADYVVYGNVQSYSGSCRFNPCSPWPWLVIDSSVYLEELLAYPAIRKVLEATYPERISKFKPKLGIIRPPKPEPDPAPFIPLMIPMGIAPDEKMDFKALNQPASPQMLRETSSMSMTKQSAGQPMAAMKATGERSISAHMIAGSARMPLGSALINDTAPYMREIAKIQDRFRIGCVEKDAPGILLRFLEYDRTASELSGGVYTGDGARQVLGLAVTDEQGNYIFRFTQTLTDIAAEVSDIVGGGADLATQLRPDLILQVISGSASGVLYESALYPDVPNLKRIDLCLPESVLNPGPTACQGGRAIQAIGNIWAITGVGDTFDADGRITATNGTGPQITRGAWGGTLDMFACFLDHTNAAYYTIRFRRHGQGWAFVQQLYTHIKFADLGLPNYTGTKVGPDTRNLAIDGGAKVPAPSYLNIELNTAEWVATHILRKMQLASAYYENLLYGPNENPRSVEFKIEAYSATGDKIGGAEDTIRLLIDNRPITGDLASIQMGVEAPSECALFELSSPNATLTVRFKVNQPGGFVSSYNLAVARGSNTAVPVGDTTPPPQPLSSSYNVMTHGNFFFGTFNGVSPDGDGYVVAELQPNSGLWLNGHNFCAFEFSIGGSPRVTNGYSNFGGGTLDKELVGMSSTPTP